MLLEKRIFKEINLSFALYEQKDKFIIVQSDLDLGLIEKRLYNGIHYEDAVVKFDNYVLDWLDYYYPTNQE